jgi:hypothetical protein
VFIQHDLFACHLERLTPEASASSTTPSTAPTPKARTPKAPTPDQSKANEYFAMRLRQQGDEQSTQRSARLYWLSPRVRRWRTTKSLVRVSSSTPP